MIQDPRTPPASGSAQEPADPEWLEEAEAVMAEALDECDGMDDVDTAQHLLRAARKTIEAGIEADLRERIARPIEQAVQEASLNSEYRRGLRSAANHIRKSS